MSRLLSISEQPEFGHLTTLKRHSDWCFLKYKLTNVKIRKTISTNRFNLIIFSLPTYSTVLFVRLFVCLCIYTYIFYLKLTLFRLKMLCRSCSDCSLKWTYLHSTQLSSPWTSTMRALHSKIQNLAMTTIVWEYLPSLNAKGKRTWKNYKKLMRFKMHELNKISSPYKGLVLVNLLSYQFTPQTCFNSALIVEP